MQSCDYILEDDTMQMSIINFIAQGGLNYLHLYHFVLLIDNLATQIEAVFQVVICFCHFQLIYYYFGNCLIWLWKEKWVLLHFPVNILSIWSHVTMANGLLMEMFYTSRYGPPNLLWQPPISNHFTARCRGLSGKTWESTRWKGHGFLNHHMESGCQLDWVRNK